MIDVADLLALASNSAGVLLRCCGGVGEGFFSMSYGDGRLCVAVNSKKLQMSNS